jgi:hypothetical protein
MSHESDMATRINELSGIVAALTAIISVMPGITRDTILDARKVMGPLIPQPAPGSASLLPPTFATRVLDQIEGVLVASGR